MIATALLAASLVTSTVLLAFSCYHLGYRRGGVEVANLWVAAWKKEHGEEAE